MVPRFVRQDPEVPQILDYLETKRKKKLGLYAEGGDVSSEQNDSTEKTFVSNGSTRTDALLEMILEATTANRDILFGAEAELKRQEQQKKLDKIKNRSRVKTTS